jgi:hypothetical protein
MILTGDITVVGTGTVVVAIDVVTVVPASSAVVVVSVEPEEQPANNIATTTSSTVTCLMSSPLVSSTLPSVSVNDLNRFSTVAQALEKAFIGQTFQPQRDSQP